MSPWVLMVISFLILLKLVFLLVNQFILLMGCCPPHNVIVEDHPELSHDSLAMLPDEDFEVAFPDSGDYTYWCEPHKGGFGMIGHVHVD